MHEKFYEKEENVAEYIDLAKDVNGREIIERLDAFLPVRSRLLELGTGPGSDWEILGEKHEVVGSDYSTPFLERLKKQFPQGEFLHIDVNAIDTKEIQSYGFYGVYSNKVLQHITDENIMALMAAQANILPKGGIICHSFWYGEGSEEFKGMYVNYQNEKSLTRFTSPHFKVLVLETYKEFDENDSILLIAELV